MEQGQENISLSSVFDKLKQFMLPLLRYVWSLFGFANVTAILKFVYAHLHMTVANTNRIIFSLEAKNQTIYPSQLHLVANGSGGSRLFSGDNLPILLKSNQIAKQALLMQGEENRDSTLVNRWVVRFRATREADLLTAGVEIGNTQENDERYFTYRGSRSVKWYIRNLAGGFAEKANRNSLAIFYPDGSVMEIRKYFGMMLDYLNLMPGAVISMTYKVPEPKMEREKIDVNTLYTMTLTSLTTLVTLLILACQL